MIEDEATTYFSKNNYENHGSYKDNCVGQFTFRCGLEEYLRFGAVNTVLIFLLETFYYELWRFFEKY